MQNRNQSFFDPWNSSTYQTGSTIPPKNHKGIIAFLLVLVIALCGVITLLGIINVRLFRQLDQAQLNQELPISFSGTQSVSDLSAMSAEAVARTDRTLMDVMGVQWESVPALYEMYYHLPKGVYLTEVTVGGVANHLGLRKGDVITAVNTTPVTAPQELENALLQAETTFPVTLTVHRGATEFLVKLNLILG